MVDSDEDGGDYAELMAASPLDIKEYAHSYAFVIDMPGMDPSDVRVQVKADNVILISSERRRAEEEGAKYITMERRMGKFMRKFALPDNANASKITTVSRNGELTVTVEKLPPPQPKEIEVKREPQPLGRRKVGIGASFDRISLLPDELLVCILSLLSFNEATASSILSRRWRSLHTFTAKIDFDCTRVLRKAGKRGFEGFDEIKRKYLGCIDSYVRLNQSSVLEKFRVFFYLTGSEAHHIDEWIRFALSKKVESLELLSIYDICAKNIKRYTLDFHKFNHDGLKLMKKLSTHMVNVSGEAVEMLSRNCPLLEQVSIAESAQLLSLKIIKPFPSLRSLEILHCHNLSLVVVDDSNIVSFKYYGERVNKVVLVNVPLLTEIWIYGMCTDRAEDALEMFSSVLPQLHTFKIGVRSFSREQLREFCSEFCSRGKMSNLKQLVVDTLQVLGDRDPLPLIDLIKASPRLQRFVIEVPYDKDRADNDFVEAEPIEIRAAASADRMLLRDYPHLKEVEFVGYRGVTKHFELLKYLVENAIALETIVVDPWGIKEPFHISFDRIPCRKYNDKVFVGAYAFKHCVPFGINVKIL